MRLQRRVRTGWGRAAASRPASDSGHALPASALPIQARLGHDYAHLPIRPPARHPGPASGDDWHEELGRERAHAPDREAGPAPAGQVITASAFRERAGLGPWAAGDPYLREIEARLREYQALRRGPSGRGARAALRILDALLHAAGRWLAERAGNHSRMVRRVRTAVTDLTRQAHQESDRIRGDAAATPAAAGVAVPRAGRSDPRGIEASRRVGIHPLLGAVSFRWLDGAATTGGDRGQAATPGGSGRAWQLGASAEGMVSAGALRGGGRPSDLILAWVAGVRRDLESGSERVSGERPGSASGRAGAGLDVAFGPLAADLAALPWAFGMPDEPSLVARLIGASRPGRAPVRGIRPAEPDRHERGRQRRKRRRGGSRALSDLLAPGILPPTPEMQDAWVAGQTADVAGSLAHRIGLRRARSQPRRGRGRRPEATHPRMPAAVSASEAARERVEGVAIRISARYSRMADGRTAGDLVISLTGYRSLGAPAFLPPGWATGSYRYHSRRNPEEAYGRTEASRG